MCLYAEPTTHFARDATMTIEVCDANPEYEYLPPYFMKRRLYHPYLWESGVIASTDNIGNISYINNTKILDWKQFRRYWNREYKYIKISQPLLSDTCGECFHIYCWHE